MSGHGIEVSFTNGAPSMVFGSVFQAGAPPIEAGQVMTFQGRRLRVDMVTPGTAPDPDRPWNCYPSWDISGTFLD